MSKRGDWLAAAEQLEAEAGFLAEEGKDYKAKVFRRLAEKARGLSLNQTDKDPKFRAGDKVNVRRANGDLVILGGTLEHGGNVPHLEDEYVFVKSEPNSRWLYNFCELTGARLVERQGRHKDEAWRWVVSKDDPEYLLLEKAE